MTLLVQSYLRSGGSLEELEAKYAIKAKVHGRHPDLVLLKYDQINSPFSEPIVRECRGIVLDQRDWSVKCLTFHKFFNHGEVHAASLDWSTARVYEKVDGTLIQLYHHEGEWQVATSGTPDANTPINNLDLTFADLFWRTAPLAGLRTEALDPAYCYAFELCSLENRVVVIHDTPRLWLHGVRRLADLREEPVEDHLHLGVPAVVSHPLGTLEEIVAASKALDPLKHEGFVAVDADFRRLKIKSPAYLALHHSKDTLASRRAMMDLIRRGEAAELGAALEAFPGLREQFRALEAAHARVVAEACADYRRHRDIAEQKAYAQAVVGQPWQAILFNLRKREVDSAEGPSAVAVKKLLAEMTMPAYDRLMEAVQK